MPTPESPFERVQSAVTALIDELWTTDVTTKNELSVLLSLLIGDDSLFDQMGEALAYFCRVWGYDFFDQNDLHQAMAGNANV
jgi:hypothetical protein